MMYLYIFPDLHAFVGSEPTETDEQLAENGDCWIIKIDGLAIIGEDGHLLPVGTVQTDVNGNTYHYHE